VHLLLAKARPTRRPCVIICKKMAFNKCSMEERRDLLQHFNPSSATLHFKELNGPPKPYEILAFQLGTEAVLMRDVQQDEVVEVASDRPFLVKLSISVPNIGESKDFAKKKESFVADVTGIIGQKLLASEVKFTRTIDEFKIRKKVYTVHQGIAFTTAENLEAVMRKSGNTGMVVQEAYRNEKYTVLRIKEEPTLENARNAAKFLGGHAFGVVMTDTGFAVRVKTADKDVAYCLYNETLTQICGVAIVGTAKADALFFQVSGVPIRMNDVELAQSLAIPRIGQAAWTCHPETRLGQPRQGCKTILVKAGQVPPKRLIKVKYVNDIVCLHITDHQQKQKELTVMQRAEIIVQKKADKDTFGTYAAALGAKPKAQPKPTMLQPKANPSAKTLWSDVEEDDASINCDEDFSDNEPEEMDTNSVEGIVSPTASPRNSMSPAAALPPPVPKHKSALMKRLQQMETERDEMREQAARENEQHLAQIQVAQAANDTAMERVIAQIEGMQQLIASHQVENTKRMNAMQQAQEAADARFATAQQASQAQFAKMLQFFDRMSKQGKPHGAGSSKGVTKGTKQVITETEDEDSAEDAGSSNKKLKVPFRTGEDPDDSTAAASGR
jgi:hypothetical protein